MRRQKEVSTSVLGSRARWFESVAQRSNPKDPSPLKIKEVWVKDRRYIVCLNEEERRKDAHAREAIVAHLKEQLRRVDKSLVGNKGYRRRPAYGADFLSKRASACFASVLHASAAF